MGGRSPLFGKADVAIKINNIGQCSFNPLTNQAQDPWIIVPRAFHRWMYGELNDSLWV